MVCSLVLLTGCVNDDFYLDNTLSTPNGTLFNAAQSFELLSFCSSTSFVTNVSPSGLSCGSGVITDVQFNSSYVNNWSAMCCVYDSTKCSIVNTSDIVLFNGLNLSAQHYLSSSYQSGFVLSCCNAQGTMCYSPIVDSSFSGCGAGYSDMWISVSNIVSNNWSVSLCLNGFN
jgi:hypothetical protein